MAQLGEGEKVAFNPTELGSGVHLFNSFGALAPLQLETRRVHPSNAGISRVEDSSLQAFYRWVSAYSRWVNPHLAGRVRLVAKRGSTASGDYGEGVATGEKESSRHSVNQSPAKAERRRREVVEEGGSGGQGVKRAGGAPAGTGRPPEDGRVSSCGSGAVPSAGWREVAECYSVEEGFGHE